MQINLVSILILLCGTTTIPFGMVAWRKRSLPGARCFALFMYVLGVYVMGYGLELASTNLALMQFWVAVEYVGIYTFPAFFLLFVAQYVGNEFLLRRKWLVALLFIVPAIMVFAKWTDPWFGLVYRNAAVDSSGIIPMISFDRGPLYLPGGILNMVPVVIGTSLLWRKRRYTSDVFRSQLTLLSASVVLPLLVYALYLTGFQPFPSLPKLDLNAVLYVVWGLSIALVLFRYQLFDLAPIAREMVIENLVDGVVVLDIQHRLVDSNPAARRIFGWRQTPVGEFASDRLKAFWNDLILPQADQPAVTEVEFTIDGQKWMFEVNASFIQTQMDRHIGCLLLFHDITERKQFEETLHELSLVDELTGLYNRRGFNLMAAQLIQMASRMKLPAAVIFADLDKMKWINDTLGHFAGDQALIHAADIFKKTFRASDIIARVGGDEFVVLAIESQENSSDMMLARLNMNFELHNQSEATMVRLSISAGHAHYLPENPVSLDVLLHEADQSMYTAKQGKNSSAIVADRPSYFE